jgi:putative MATE family efflux protein
MGKGLTVEETSVQSGFDQGNRHQINLEFKKEVKILVVPSILQMLIGNSFSFIDTLMISGLGDEAVAALAAAGQFSFILGMILAAVYGSASFITQFSGKGDLESVKKVHGLMLLSSFIISILAFFIVFFFKKELLMLFSKDEKVLLYGVQYISLIAYVYILNAVKDSYVQSLGALGKIKINVYIGLLGMLVNTLFNYLLIYGKGGFPEYGIKGAALATIVSSVVVLVITIAFINKNQYYIYGNIKEFFAFDWPFAKKILSKTLPIIGHESLWSVGNMLYAVAFGHMGVVALVTFQLIQTFSNYFRIGIAGFAYAAKIMIGKKLGNEDSSDAILYAKKFTGISIYSALIIGGFIVLLNPFIIGVLSNLSEESRLVFRNILYIKAFVVFANFLNNIWIIGIFRPGGDNLYTMKLIFITTWFIGIPLVFAGAYIFKWPIEVVYIMFASEEMVKACIGYFRYRSNKWANNLVKDM